MATLTQFQKDYRKKLLDPRWQKIRLEVFERDKFKCIHCGDDKNTLHAHHTFYEANNDPWDYEDIYIITLCSSCHSNFHNKKKIVIDELNKSILSCGFSAESLCVLAAGFELLSWDRNKKTMKDMALIIAHLVSDMDYRNKTLSDVYSIDNAKDFDLKESFIDEHVNYILNNE